MRNNVFVSVKYRIVAIYNVNRVTIKCLNHVKSLHVKINLSKHLIICNIQLDILLAYFSEVIQFEKWFSNYYYEWVNPFVNVWIDTYKF